MAKTKDAADILKQLEADEREAYAKFEAEQRAKREKALDAILKPKLARIEELTNQMDEMQKEQDQLLKEVAKLTGRDASPKAKKGDSGKRTRRGEDDLRADAEKVADAIKAAGKEGAKGGELKKVAKPMAGMNFKKFVETYTDHKIRATGAKASTRYFIG